MKDYSVKCSHVKKDYPLYRGDFDRLKGFLMPSYKPPLFCALQDIDLTIKKKEIFGIIGVNGSGKSTLSNIIAGITYPTHGSLEVEGNVNILSANAGMENHLTGIENIYFKSALLGFSDKYVEEIKNQIIEFADIGEHIYQPVRTYSSGMRSRLGFAISIHMNPEILIIDEGLAVGDGSFYEKCIDKMQEIKNSGKTIVYITHSVIGMEDFCDRVMWLHKGVVVGVEEPKKMVMPYCGFTREFASMSNEERKDYIPCLEDFQKKYL